MATSYVIKYPFFAQFKDGSSYTQNSSDIPQIAYNGSAFTDLKDRLNDIEWFGLLNPEGKAFAKVSLINGLFELNGILFKAQNPKTSNFPIDTEYRLIYFRKVTRNFNIGTKQELSISIEYHIGWQTTIDGENYQQTISVS